MAGNLFSRIKRKLSRHPLLIRSSVITLGVLFTGIIFFFFIAPVVKLATNIPVSPAGFFANPEKQLTSSNGRVNVLLLGIGGQLHDGPNLTDTMILASIPLSKGPVHLVSIPRDLYYEPIEGKINSAYAIGQEKNGGGMILSKAAVSQITGLPVHYGVRLDFSAFSEIVDLIGGIDVNVPEAFEDLRYPIEGRENDNCGGDPDFKCRYETLRFDQGLVHMDGKTALKYSRSRYANGDQGTDFARSKRQQAVISAIKNKLISLPSLLNFNRLLEVYNSLKSHIDMDIADKDINAFFKLGLSEKDAQIESISIEDQLVNPPIDDRGWILLPKSGDFAEIHQYLKAKIYP